MILRSTTPKEPAEATKSPITNSSEDAVDPKLDVVFKRLFGDERNKPLLLSLLNAILTGPQDALIVEVQILSPYLEKDQIHEKHPILDLKLRDRDGKLYNVELQCESQPSFVARIVYYWAKLFASQLKKNEPYSQIRPVYSIVLANFLLLDEGITGFHNCFVPKERHSNLELTDLMELHFLELPRFSCSYPPVLTPCTIALLKMKAIAYLTEE